MSLFDKLGQQASQSGEDLRNALGSIKSDPCTFLQGRGFSIPGGMSDPKQITQHLLRTGQIGNGKLQQVLRMLGAPGIR